MRIEIFLQALSLLALTAFCAGACAKHYGFARNRHAKSGRRRKRWALFILFAGLFSLLLLRPHRHTWQGLDCSAYRLMARVYLDGGGHHSIDKTLLELPRDLRFAVLLSTTLKDRLTRDRSFEISDLDRCATQPYFYPILPLAMAGFDRLAPGEAMDYLPPLLLLLLAATLMARGAGAAGGPGLMLAAALLLGSPLLAGLGRGAYAEVCGAVLLALGAGAWLRAGVPSLPVSAALGLSCAFHPSLLAPAGLIFILTLLNDTPRNAGKNSADSDTRGRIRPRMMSALVFLGAGPAVLLAFTGRVAQPYFSLNLKFARYFYFHRPEGFVFVCCFIFAGSVLAAVLIFTDTLQHMIRSAWRRHRRLFVAVTALGPLLTWALLYVSGNEALKNAVTVGTAEFMAALPLPFGILVLGLLLFTFWQRQSNRLTALAAVALTCAPLYFALKGFEQMGFWSQRRLAPLLLLLLPVLLESGLILRRRLNTGLHARRAIPPGGMGKIVKTARRLRRPAALALLWIAGGWSFARWPTPYLLREEQGAPDAFRAMKSRIGSRLAIFDYYPYSVPFATDNALRAIGLNQFAFHRIQDFVSLALDENHRENGALWISAYQNPGIEMDAFLRHEGSFHASLPVIRARRATPSKPGKREIAMNAFSFVPLRSSSRPPALNKIFDGGPLALRPPWEPRTAEISIPGEKSLPAQWSRQGSGVIGPIPPPGSTVEIIAEGASGRTNGPSSRIRILPPWDEKKQAELVFSPLFSTNSCSIKRPLDPENSGPSGERQTGVYRLYAESPYDPGKDGFSGYSADLGVLWHSLQIRVAPAPAN